MKVVSLSPNYYAFPDSIGKVTSLKKDNSGKIIIGDERYSVDKVAEEGLEVNILIYEDRVNGWFLDFAKKLKKERHAGFIILMICASYLEGNQQFREGRKSKVGENCFMLTKSLNRMFKIPTENKKVIDLFIKEVRHGLFHDGMTRDRVKINANIKSALLMDEQKETILINPHLFLELIDIDFEIYMKCLKNKKNKKERENFDKCWKEMYR